MFKLDTSDIDRAIADVQSILNDANLTTLFTRVGRVVGVATESVVSEYPEPSGKPLEVFYDRTSTAKKPYRPYKGAPLRTPGASFRSKFKSKRQQGKVFYEIGRGNVPYRRTGTLGKSVTSQVTEADASGATVSIGTNVPYGRFVIGDEDQSNYHKGTWTPLSQDITTNLPTIQAAADTEAERALGDIISGL